MYGSLQLLGCLQTDLQHSGLSAVYPCTDHWLQLLKSYVLHILEKKTDFGDWERVSVTMTCA